MATGRRCNAGISGDCSWPRGNSPQPRPTKILQQLEDRGSLKPRVQRQPGVAEVLIEIAAEITRRLGQAQRQSGNRLQRQRRIAHQLREVLWMKYQLDAGFHQRLRLEMQLL